ncbi:hypothetical protein Lesp02_83160 [Lentzea sp. NBRC 105346]|nr:hypothetical protein Lesp02_83160 [Lentzea sp. NBRC 105346]
MTGPPGCGKTRLLSEFSTQARENGAVVLNAVCSSAEHHQPLGVVSQIVPGINNNESPRLFHESLTNRGPLCLVVDDVHHADPASLECLSYLVRRLGSSPITLVISSDGRGPRPDFHACTRIRLPLLSVRGVTRLLAQHLSPDEAGRLAPSWHAASGGNPELALALAQDLHSYRRRVSGAADLITGDAYRQAVVACLVRGGPDLLEVAAALALLGDAPVPLGELLGIREEQAELAVAALSDMGLVERGRFAHPAARTAVLGTLASDARGALHRRAIRLLHQSGAPARLVAEQLIASGNVQDQWVLPVLEEAAQDALARNELHLADQCLRLAVRVCEDPDRRNTLLVKLLSAEWAIDPSIGARHVPSLITAARRGELTGRELMVLVYQSLWFGRLEDARSLFAKEMPLAEAAILRLWLGCFVPPLLPFLDGGGVAPSDDLRWLALTGLSDVLCSRATAQTLVSLEQVLERCLPNAQPLQPELTAICALIYAGELDRADTWVERLLDSAPQRNAPSWEAGFFSLLAEIAWRRGDAPSAVRWARASMDYVSPQGWGVAIGRARAILVLAALEAGDLDEAADQLDHPFPPGMLQSLWGVHYQHARGRFQLACGNLHAALGEFLRCGDQMTAWGMDHPAVVPWRASAAEAYLRLGRPDRATLISAAIPATPLTDAERRVAMLAAEGHPNRSISRQLRITVSTVEQHLTRCYRKLNVTSRQQLAERLHLFATN